MKALWTGLIQKINKLFFNKDGFHRAFISGLNRVIAFFSADNLGLALGIKAESVGADLGAASAANAFILINGYFHIMQ